MNYLKSYKLFESNNSYNYLLDKEKAITALNEGFVIICGEKHREFITKISNEIVDLGMSNGERWVNDIILKGKIADNLDLLENCMQDKVDEFLTGIKEYFTDIEIEQIRKNGSSRSGVYEQEYMQGLDKYQSLIVKTIKEKDIILKYATPFNYFKEFPLSSKKRFSSVTLYSEGGLGLDQYDTSSLGYYKEEGELCYPIEAICRKYHYLGMLLKKQEILLQWVDKIKSKLTKETNRWVSKSLVDIIYNLATDSNADEIILSIQSATGVVEGFNTHQQVSDSIRNIKNVDLPDTLFDDDDKK
jgi:hypothetical protein